MGVTTNSSIWPQHNSDFALRISWLSANIGSILYSGKRGISIPSVSAKYGKLEYYTECNRRKAISLVALPWSRGRKGVAVLNYKISFLFPAGTGVICWQGLALEHCYVHNRGCAAAKFKLIARICCLRLPLQLSLRDRSCLTHGDSQKQRKEFSDFLERAALALEGRIRVGSIDIHIRYE